MIRAVAILLLACVVPAMAMGDRAYRQAQFDYQLHCQGCHSPDGAGADTVPRLKGHVGLFLGSTSGREYLVRVPGSAISALDDERLAGVLNWIVLEFAGDSLADDFRPYSAEEVGQSRRRPLNEVDQYRGQLLRVLVDTTGGEQ
ncbi:MAG: c-type cytochrome [Parahaliea sp.]